ncbi:MAG: cytidylate kinase-like family protein [Clostridia bacterium]|nr:cytidylate kinase-like family protein [Clostridia bacterium]
MKLITISREFGSGGRELGRRLADLLGYDYYDREIITAIAQKCDKNESFVEYALENHWWQTVSLTFSRSFAASAPLQEMQMQILGAEQEILRGIAEAGKDCIIVGRNADVKLRECDPLRIFVCADRDSKIDRCLARAVEGEELTRKQVQKQMQEIDRNRARTRSFLTDDKWGDRASYDLVVNTTGWEMRELAPAVADFATRYFARKSKTDPMK